MKETSILKLVLYLIIAVLSHSALGQENQNVEYSVFNPKNMNKEYFVTTNSGILKTPYGIKVGYICNPGIYLGFRYGKGEVYNSDSDGKTVSSNLYSIVGGLTKPLVIKNDFSLVAQLGVGYGQWWDYRWERWTKSGVEIEAGLLLKKKHFLFNITGNVLNGSKTYATGDLSLGFGYVF